MICSHKLVVVTDYNTQICTCCGIETQVCIVPQLSYGNSSPLVLGYSRGARFKTILEKLLNPRVYGKANHRVLYELSRLPKNHFKNGFELLKWLAALRIPNKNYQCSHYYYIYVTKPKEYPTPPPIVVMNALEQQFNQIENKYLASSQDFRSFFSYNWILKKLLENNDLDYYIQFVKPIKCKRRLIKYNAMYTKIMNEDNVVVSLESLQNCQTLPDEPQDDETESRPSQLFVLTLQARMRLQMVVTSSFETKAVGSFLLK